MKDHFGREVSNLRISVTHKCNLACFYCHREGQPSSEKEMKPHEIEKIVSIGAELGISKIKLTGGEPLLRKDITEIVSRVATHAEEVSLVTNGVLLKRYARELKKAGLTRINISLDSIDATNYNLIIGKDYLSEVISGIREANEVGLHPLKLNMVIMRNLNENEIERMIKFAMENDAILQLIELEATKEGINGNFYQSHHLDLSGVEGELEKRAVKVAQRRMQQRRKYWIPNGGDVAEVEIVKPMHNTRFCSACTRIRLTSDGKLKPCLLRNDNLVDILTPLRRGAGADELHSLFLKAISLREPYWQ